MRKNAALVAICFIAFFVPALSLCQEPGQKAGSAVIIEGKIVSRHNLIALITADAKGYILNKAEGQEETFNTVKEFIDKDFDLVLSAIESGRIKKFTITDYQKNQSWAEEFKVVEVVSINEVKPGSKVTSTNISRAEPVKSRPKLPAPAQALKKISGKISKCNLKSVIPTIELEGKPDFVIMLPADTQTAKVIGENLVAFKPKDVLKAGLEVEIWYEEKGYIRNARIITIREKDITGQEK